jgi:hypothetical protein
MASGGGRSTRALPSIAQNEPAEGNLSLSGRSRRDFEAATLVGSVGGGGEAVY